MLCCNLLSPLFLDLYRANIWFDVSLGHLRFDATTIRCLKVQLLLVCIEVLVTTEIPRDFRVISELGSG